MRTKLSSALIVLIATLSASAFAENDLIKVDVSGRHGQKGSDGVSHTGHASTNRDGSDGGHAGPAEAGQSSGNVDLKLQSDGKGGIVLKGRVTPAVGKPGDFQKSAVVGTKGYIPLLAVGGDGGTGGNGGKGEDGGRGGRWIGCEPVCFGHVGR